MKLQEQESFARQEQRKEESRVANKVCPSLHPPILLALQFIY